MKEKYFLGFGNHCVYIAKCFTELYFVSGSYLALQSSFRERYDWLVADKMGDVSELNYEMYHSIFYC